MRPHENLRTWIESMELVVDVYQLTDSFPREERYGLTSQIRRAAVSIPANLAEGAARTSKKEFAHFCSTAQGSASELETELILANRLGYLTQSSFIKVTADLERIGKMITGLRKRLSFETS